MKSILLRIGSIPLLVAGLVSIASADLANDTGSPTSAPTVKAPTAAAAFTASYTLTTASATQTGRLFRDANASTCASPKSYPGLWDSATYRHVVSEAFTNTSGSSVCATITLTSDASCVGSVFATAYLGSFNVADLGQNYLGDSGSSIISPSAAINFEIQVPSNGTVVFNLNDNADSGENCGFSLSSPDLVAANAEPPAPTPTLDLRAIGLLIAALLAIGFIWLRRRTA